VLNTAAEKWSYATRLGAFYAALFVVLGGSMAYLPSWLLSKGFSAAEIGWLAAAPMLLRLAVTPAVAFVADRYSVHERVTVLLAGFGGLAVLLMAGRTSFWLIAALVLVFQLSIQSTMPMAETIAMRGVRYGGLDYGRMRLWGSLSFVVGTYLCGVLVEQRGAAMVVWFIFSGVMLTLAAAIMLPAQLSRPVDASAVVQAPAGATGWSEFLNTLRLVLSPSIVLFLLASGAVQAAHALFYTFGVIHWRSLGLSTVWIGSLWAISIAVEILLFSVSSALIARIGAWNMVALGAAASVIRWTAMAFDPGLPWLVLLQILHAATFAGTHVGAMHFIREAVPEHQAGMVQALNVTVTTGLLMGLAQVLAGQTYGLFGARSYLGMAGVALLGLTLCLVRRR
jgi:MFS transporter, PPP family, 3-phenylpropionic acid transporter